MRLSSVLYSLILATAATSAAAHTRIKPNSSLKPRNDSGGNKTGPCGDTPVDEAKRTTLTAGADLKVEWEETIQHTSHFRIAFSPDGATGFDQNVIKDNIVDDQDQSGPDNQTQSTFHQFNTTVKVPDQACDKCAIQVIQVMLDNHPTNPTYYYSCADVKIVKGTTSGTSTGTTTKPAAPKNLKVKVKAKS